jgi:hypothetical protein
MDDDSLLVSKLAYDPFEKIHTSNLTYIYKRTEVDHWGIKQLWDVARPYVLHPRRVASNRIVRSQFLSQEGGYLYDDDGRDQKRRPQEQLDLEGDGVDIEYYGLQPYNNFHLSRIDFWKSETWKQFMADMDERHLFYKYRVGDANVHAMAVLMMGDGRSEKWYDVPYVHNSNDMGDEWGKKEWKQECDDDLVGSSQ